jgi:hypothetical protein
MKQRPCGRFSAAKEISHRHTGERHVLDGTHLFTATASTEHIAMLEHAAAFNGHNAHAMGAAKLVRCNLQNTILGN